MSIYLVHAAFYSPFLMRVIGSKWSESVKKAPHARMLVGLHMLAFGLTYFGVGDAVFRGPVTLLGNVSWAGAAVILASGALAASALWVFRSWRFSAELDSKHELVTSGPFGLVRHPIYLALDGLQLGTALWFPNPFTIAGLIVGIIAGDARGRAEEKLLVENFGDSYRVHMKRVKRFIPFIYVWLFALVAQATPSPPPIDRLKATGLESKDLDGEKKEMALAILDREPSPCGKAHSLYTSLVKDKACKKAPFAGRFALFLVSLGLTAEEVQQHYEDRFVNPHRAECKPGAPVRGDEKAPLTICEFSDYQCPHCKAAEPILKKLLEDYKGRVKLAFKNFPLSSHADARPAAAAAVAAGWQGKFWPMHDLLFDHQERMSSADLEKYARELKLDIEKWKKDLGPAGAKVDADRAEGLKLEVDHTPTIYIADREYKGPLRYEFIKDWVDEALAK